MKKLKLTLILVLLLITSQAFALNPASVDIKVIINKPPSIGNFEPADGYTVNEGDTLQISVTANDPNNDILQYQFIINDVVKKAWSNESSFSYVLRSEDIGLNKIKAEVKDDLEIVPTKEVEIYVFRKTLALPQ